MTRRRTSHFRQAQHDLLALMLDEVSGPTILSYWDDPIELIIQGKWVNVPRAANSWLVPAHVDMSALLDELYLGNWTIYHLRSHDQLKPWAVQPSGSLSEICRSMVAGGVDVAMDAAYDNDWFDLYVAPGLPSATG